MTQLPNNHLHSAMYVLHNYFICMYYTSNTACNKLNLINILKTHQTYTIAIVYLYMQKIGQQENTNSWHIFTESYKKLKISCIPKN